MLPRKADLATLGIRLDSKDRLQEVLVIKIELPYVTVTVDDRFRARMARAGDRLRVTLTAYLRNAADEADGLGRKASVACQTAASRVETAMTAASNRIAPEPEPRTPTLKVV